MNLRISKNNICYYCGKNADGGKQHIPAKMFFPDNMRKNLIKVPSCKVHNQEIQKLEERNLIEFFLQSRSPEAEKHSEKLINDLKRPERKLFSDSLANIYRDINGESGGLIVDMNDIDEYMNYVISGLFFYHTKNVNKGVIKHINKKEKPVKYWIQLIKSKFYYLIQGDSHNKDIFNYRYCLFNSRNKLNKDSFWYLTFYNEISWIAVVNN